MRFGLLGVLFAVLAGCPATPPDPGCGAGCPSGQSCAGDRCYPDDCAGQACLEKQVCPAAQCLDKKCLGVSCAGASICADGDCLPTACSFGDCAPEHGCVSEQCVDVRCYGVICPTGNTCAEGLCVPNNCTAQSCAAGQGCVNDNCADVSCLGVICPGSTACAGGRCVGANCGDATRNGAETDVDCGGAACPKCPTDAGCTQPSDCVSNRCGTGRCRPDPCADGLRNGDETDVDCGGAVCSRCDDGKMCTSGTDCRGAQCPAGVCLATCADALRNNSETDVDCGGPFCPRCGVDGGCTNYVDCQGGICRGSKCQPDSCTDGWRNGSETDVDCGGTCPQCLGGSRCFLAAECVGGVCANAGFPADGGVCTGPTCADGVKSDAGFETDVDCGGGRCRPCRNTLLCNVNTDCQYRLCNVGACVAFTVTFPRSTPPDSVTRWCSPSGTCADAGEDGDFYAPVPTYTTNADAVHDSVTNLTWQRVFNPNPSTWQRAWEVCDGLNLGGYTDWRLPSRYELFTITDLGRTPVPLDGTLFPGVAPQTFFWTSSMDYTNSTTYTAQTLLYANFFGPPLRFGRRASAAGPSATATHHSRCMRTLTPPLPSPRFIGYPNSVGDDVTKLQWQEPTVVTSFTWTAAKNYCNNLVLDALSDWRLPSAKELESITRDFAVGTLMDVVFVNPPLDVWSSSPITGSTTAAYQFSYTASTGPDLVQTSIGTALRVRCVRGPN